MATPPKTIKPDLGSLRITDAKRTKSGAVNKWVFLPLGMLAIVLVAGGALAFRSRKPAVEVAAARKPVSGPAGVLNASGYVTPRQRATIAAKITGRVTGVYIDEGTRVAAGQLLATLDDSDAKRALDSAKADREASQAAIADYVVQLKNAEIELHRSEQLVAGGVQTQQALDAARTNADSLKAKIDLAKQQVLAADARISVAQQAVDNCTIRAPFAGIAVSKDAQIGEMVSPVSAGGGFTRTGIATIVDLHSNEIEVDVSEAYIANVKPNQLVHAILDAYPDWQIDGKVRTVIPTADRQKATVKVRISFAFDPATEPRILPDMGVKVTFLEEAKAVKKDDKGAHDPVLALVPQGAVREEGGAKYVLVLKNELLERRAVKTGAAHGADVEILAGLMPDAQVVVKGPENLHDGQAVQVKQ